MKKSSLKTKEPSPLASKSKWLLGLVGLLIIVGWAAPALVTGTAAVVSYPVHMVRTWFATSDHSLALYIRDKQELLDTISDLEHTIARETGTTRSIERLQDENAELQALLGNEEEERIAARVLARPNHLPYDVVQIDQGRVDGVVVDAPVFYGVDQVIGFVLHVARDHSLVSLVTTPRQRATAYVLGPDIYTTAEGVGNGMLRVRVPRGVDVSAGDLVILPAVASGVYGEIVHVETTPTQPEQFGYVSLPVSLHGLRYVSVGRQPITPASFDDVQKIVEQAREDLLRVPIPEEFQVGTTTPTTTPATTPAASTTTPDTTQSTSVPETP